MQPFVIALALVTGLVAGASAQWDAPLTDPLACVAEVQQATDPATAADAYQRGWEFGADRTLLNQSYVQRMIELGLPGQAEEAAEQLVEANPQDGVAWAVLAYCDAARNDTTAALAEMATAMDCASDDPFVLGVAGKLMAWYRDPMLGDPSELPTELAVRLDDIHARYSANEYYAVAFRAASEFYASQGGHPIAEGPGDIVHPELDEFAYDPVVCTTYNEPVYAGFTVPCFSYRYVVPRVRTYVQYERRVHRHLRYHIQDRHTHYRTAVHGRRVVCERSTRPCAYYVAGHIRITPPRGVALPPPRPRHARATVSVPAVNRQFGRTRPPQVTPRQITISRRAPVGDHQTVRPRSTVQPTPRSEVRPQPAAERRSQIRPRNEPPAPTVRPAPRPRSDARPAARPDGQPAPRSRSEARPQARPDRQPRAKPQPAPPAPKAQPTPRPRSEARPQARPEGRSEVKPHKTPPSPKAQPAPRPRSEARPHARPAERPQARPQSSPKAQPPPAKNSSANPRRSR